MGDAFVWRAIYRDGDVIDEFKDDGSGKTHGFAAIEHERLVAFVLIPQRPGLPTPNVMVPQDDPDFRVIFFRRRELTFSPTEHRETAPRTTRHVLGFQRHVGDAVVSCYSVFYEDGSVLVTDDPEAF